MADEPTGRFVALALSHGIFETEFVGNLSVARERCSEWKPHLLILDIDVRDGDALDLVAVRVGGRRTPTIAITQRGDLRTKLAAFDRGADDFMSTPITPEELVARALAVVRRSYGDEVPFVPIIRVTGLEIDLLNRLARVSGEKLELTPMEQALLYLLASNADRTLDREEIVDAIWGSDFVADSNLVDRHIRNLRVKLRDDWRHPTFIRTVPGRGYRFVGRPNAPSDDRRRRTSGTSGGGFLRLSAEPQSNMSLGPMPHERHSQERERQS